MKKPEIKLSPPVLLHPALVEGPGELLHGDVPHQVVAPVRDVELDPAGGAPHHLGMLLASLAHDMTIPVNVLC